jgi:hypothetical protein
MNIYHYTKGISINSIFTDGFIATERKRGLSSISKNTDCVWLTEKSQFPKTALPFISQMPETNLRIHMNNNVYVNLHKLSEFVGGVYRFSFDSSDSRFEKWRFSNARKVVENNIEWRHMESIANKVGDEVRSFWISESDVVLSNFTLEHFENGTWNTLLHHCSLSKLSDDEKRLIEKITSRSLSICQAYGLPAHQVKKAA